MTTADDVMKKVSAEADTFSTKIAQLAGSDANLRQGVLKSALREVIWALDGSFPDDTYELADFLDLMAGLVREKESE